MTLDLLSFLNVLPQADSAAFCAHAAQLGYSIFSIDGNSILSVEDFFHEARVELPFSPPLEGVNFDGFADSLWGGIVDYCQLHNRDRVAICWNRADLLLSSDLQALLEIVLVLADTNRTLVPDYGADRRITLSLILAGSGPAFQSFRRRGV